MHTRCLSITPLVMIRLDILRRVTDTEDVVSTKASFLSSNLFLDQSASGRANLYATLCVDGCEQMGRGCDWGGDLASCYLTLSVQSGPY